MIKILVVEDEAPIRDEVVDWLQFEGYHAIGVANGRLGLDFALQEIPDLIISDIAMPIMDGYELLLEVRSNPHLSNVPFIFLTASAERESMRKGMDMGADDYLTKPFTHAEVLNAVQSRLDKKTTQEIAVKVQFERLNSALSEERERRLLKSRLIAMFSHDFRNPLTAILSSSNIIRNYSDRISEDRKQMHLDRIDGSVHLLIQMLDEMLVVAEMEGGHVEYTPEVMDFGMFVQSIVEEFRLIDRETHFINLECSLYRPIAFDPKLMRQILANLLSNALKYSNQGSTVSLKVWAQGQTCYIEVLDHGMGIPQDSLINLFEPFYRAPNAKNIKGTGLGLAIVRDCIERHQGGIQVESEVGVGTRFTVTFSME